MTPLQFEARYAKRWDELEAALDVADRLSARRGPFDPPRFGPARPLDLARLAWLYRGACEQLALARAREYPLPVVERLGRLTARAHQQIYHRRSVAPRRMARLWLVEIPQAVRAQRGCMLLALLVFVLPLVGCAIAATLDPHFALMVHDADRLRQYERMYGDGNFSLGRTRTAETDFQMLGFYILNNIGIGFRTFAGGLFLGIGALLVLVFNGVFAGTVAGHLGARGLADNFYAFVVTHGAFELPAIVLAGGAGLALGWSLIAPGRRRRSVALREDALALVPVMYGVFGMLVVAAVLEAFWSSARWVPHEVKYGVGALCWVLVLGWLLWQGRARRVAPAAPVVEGSDAH